MSGWPGAYKELLRELSAGRGRPALVDGASPHALSATARLGAHASVLSLGEVVAMLETEPVVWDILATVGDRPTLLVDIDVLFTPALGVKVLTQLRLLAKRRPLIVLWPGNIEDDRLSYSRPGRIDHLDEPARDLVVLHPVPTEFPDETPYRLECFPA